MVAAMQTGTSMPETYLLPPRRPLIKQLNIRQVGKKGRMAQSTEVSSV